LPELCRTTVGDVSSVVTRFAFVTAEPPGRNSSTFPVTTIASPTATVGAEPVKTMSASLVSGSASGCGSCMKKRLDATAVTMPGTSTRWPASGETWAAPWTSWIFAAVAGGGGGGPLPPTGEGVPAVKSALLLSVSTVPPPLRSAAVMLLSVGAGPSPSKSFAAP